MNDVIIGMDLASEPDKTVRVILVVDSPRYAMVRHHAALLAALSGIDVLEVREQIPDGFRGCGIDKIIDSTCREVREEKLLVAAPSTTKNKGPQPRRRFPVRR